jgi:hypothetical protein
MILFQYSSEMVSVGMKVGLIPAQLNTWSIFPYFPTTSSTKPFTLSVAETSNADVRCSWLCVEEHRDWVSAREDGLTSCSAHVPPREESLMAVARPIPEPAPVMSIILFVNDGGMVGGRAVDITCILCALRMGRIDG